MHYYCGIRISKRCEDKSNVKHRNNKLFDVFIFVYHSEFVRNNEGLTRGWDGSSFRFIELKKKKKQLTEKSFCL